MPKQRRLTPFGLGLVLSAGVLYAVPPDLGPDHTFTPKAQWTDELGQTHIRYEHRYKGLRVWGSEMVDHLGPGAAQPTLKLKVPSALPPRARVPLTGLARTGEAVLWPEVVEVPVVPDPDAELMDHQAVDFRNALYLQALDTDADQEAWDFVVDADTGEVLEQIPVQETQTAAKGVGNPLFRGQVTLDTTAIGGAFQLQDLTRGANGAFGHNFVADGRYLPEPSFVYANPTNLWGDGKLETSQVNTSTANGQTMAVDMAAGTLVAGSYTAPAVPGTYTVVATSAADPTLTAQAQVTVKTTDLNGNGITQLDFGDMALFADAYGTGLAAADFNGDGTVDDLDANLFLSRFGGNP